MAGSWVAGFVRRWSGEIWLLSQAAVAATVAWAVAREIGDDHDPFFAPVAAVVALNFARGERGLSAVRLVAGVGIGIAAGELMVILFGGGYLSLALAIMLAMLAAQALGPNLLLRNQAAAGAVLTVAVAGGEAGFHRLVDALIGAGVALVFTQVLFTPLPISLVRRAEAAVLRSMRDGLRVLAAAIERDDPELSRVTAEQLTAVRTELSELTRTVRASERVTRHSVLGRAQAPQLAEVREEAGQLEMLGSSCSLLMRSAAAAAPDQLVTLVPAMRELSNILGDLALDLEDVEVRQRAADAAHGLIREVLLADTTIDLLMAGAIASLRMVAYDVMVFAGVAEHTAAEAAREELDEVRVIAPPKQHIPFISSIPINARWRRPIPTRLRRTIRARLRRSWRFREPGAGD